MPTGDDLAIVVQLLHRALRDHEQTRVALDGISERWAKERRAITDEIERLRRARAASEDRQFGLAVGVLLAVALGLLSLAIEFSRGMP